ncbi:MAG: helix-turn-helix domain-containing protein [Acidobacteriota bacterium]
MKLRLLDGRDIDLVGVNEAGRRFLRDLREMDRSDVSYFEIYRAALGPGSPALRGRNRVNRAIADSPLYLAARDIATRAGVRQGLILAPDQYSAGESAPTDASMMSVTQTADKIGITRAAVYKAIEAGRLEARRIGNVTVVARSAVQKYWERRKRTTS